MPHIRYRIPLLSAAAILAYAKQAPDGFHTISLNRTETGTVILRGNAEQENNAIFHQAMCVLHGEEYKSPEKDTVIDDLYDVLIYLDFSGVFDRDAKRKKYADRQKKAESLFRPEGISLDLGNGPHRYLAFERSGNMSRHARLSFVRADVYEPLRERMMLGMKIGICQLSKLYAYNGLMFSSGTRVECDGLFDPDSIVVIDDPKEIFRGIPVVTVQDRTGTGEVRRYERVEKTADIEVTEFDGEGLVSPDFASVINAALDDGISHTSFQIRLPYIKGMVHSVDFAGLFRMAAIGEIKDMWGVSHPVGKIRMILTKSQFKGCGSMRENRIAFSEYLARCRRFGHALYISGADTPSGNYTELNYQFLSTLSLTADSFRPFDKPLGWDTDPENEREQWLTKTTEERYYRLQNDYFTRFDFIVDNASRKPGTKSYALAQCLYRNDLLIDEKVFVDQLDRELDRIVTEYARGNITVCGCVRYLSGDLMLFLRGLLAPYAENNPDADKVCAELEMGQLSDDEVYCPELMGGSERYAVLLRNPHISRNEDVSARFPSVHSRLREWLFGHLTGIAMVSPQSLIAERLGGADYDGDRIKVILEPLLSDCMAGDGKKALPLLHIPAAEPRLVDASDWRARFETVKSTFSSRVGQISNAALDRTLVAYDREAQPERREHYRREAESLAILTGLEIDSAKSGIKPDLSDYLDRPSVERTPFLRYKNLLDSASANRQANAPHFPGNFEKELEKTDWTAVTSAVERLPYLAYMLKKHTTKRERHPAPYDKLFFFATHSGWQEQLDPEHLRMTEEIIEAYRKCLTRIRAIRHSLTGKGRRKDIERILFMRDEDAQTDIDALYTLFPCLSPERVADVRRALKERSWHLMPEEKRLPLLTELLPEAEFSGYYELFCDFRHGGYRLLLDLVADADDENRRRSRLRLNYENDPPIMNRLTEAYKNAPDTGWREAVADACRLELYRAVPQYAMFRCVVALDERDFIWDVLWREAEYYLN